MRSSLQPSVGDFPPHPPPYPAQGSLGWTELLESTVIMGGTGAPPKGCVHILPPEPGEGTLLGRGPCRYSQAKDLEMRSPWAAGVPEAHDQCPSWRRQRAMEPGKKGMESAVGVAVPPALRTSGPRRPDHWLGSPAEPLDHETGPCGCEDVGWVPTCAAALGNRLKPRTLSVTWPELLASWPAPRGA